MISSLGCPHQPLCHFNNTSAFGGRTRVLSVPRETVTAVGGQVPLAGSIIPLAPKKKGRAGHPIRTRYKTERSAQGHILSPAAILPLKSYQTVPDYRTGVSLEKERYPRKSSFTAASSLDATTFERTLGPSPLGRRERPVSLGSPLALGPRR